MAKVPEYHTTIEYNGDTYYVRPLIMSDKAFFVETWADFPTESQTPNPERTFEKRINMWLTQLTNANKGYLPMVKGGNWHPNNIFYKNDTAFGIQYADLIWEGEEVISKNSTVAIHPAFRGQGLTTVINGHGQYWTYSDEAKLPASKTYYEMGHANILGRQHQKDKGYTHIRSRAANTFKAPNTSPVVHEFSHAKTQRQDYLPGATYEVTLHEYDFTNDRYGTEYVTSGQRDRDIAGSVVAPWDHNL